MAGWLATEEVDFNQQGVENFVAVHTWKSSRKAIQGVSKRALQL